MNSLISEQGDWLRGMHLLRNQLLEVLTTADLGFSLPGNPTLGEEFRREAEIERSYADSFKSFQQDFASSKSDPALATDLDKLKAYFQAVDADLMGTLEGFSENDLGQMIDRGSSYPVTMQVQIYLQAVLIFFGKATVYYRAAGKTLPDQWAEWIG